MCVCVCVCVCVNVSWRFCKWSGIAFVSMGTCASACAVRADAISGRHSTQKSEGILQDSSTRFTLVCICRCTRTSCANTHAYCVFMRACTTGVACAVRARFMRTPFPDVTAARVLSTMSRRNCVFVRFNVQSGPGGASCCQPL